MNSDHDGTVTADTPAGHALSGPRLGRVLVGLGLTVAGVGILAAGSWLSVPFYPVPLTMQTLAVLLVGGLLGPRRGPAAVAGYLALGLAGAPVFHNGFAGPAVLFGPTGGYLLGFVPAAFLMGLAARHAGIVDGGWSVRRSRVPGFYRSGGGARKDIAVLSRPPEDEALTFEAHRPARYSVVGRAKGAVGRASSVLVPLAVTTPRTRDVVLPRPVKQIAVLTAGALLAEAAFYVCGVPWLAVAYTAGDLKRALALGAVPYLLGDVLKLAVAVGALRLGAAAVRGRRLFSR